MITRTSSPLRKALNLQNVPRWGICARYKEQSVAEHSFNVAVIAGEIAQGMGWVPAIVMYAAMYHDVDEAYTGDIPATNKEHKIPDSEIGKVVRIADLIESQLWWSRWGKRDDEITTYIRGRLNGALDAAPADMRHAASRVIEEIYAKEDIRA